MDIDKFELDSDEILEYISSDGFWKNKQSNDIQSAFETFKLYVKNFFWEVI